MVGARASPNNRPVRTAPSRVTDSPVSAACPSARLACRGSDSRKGRTVAQRKTSARIEAPSYLRTAEVADILHVSPKTVSRWAKEGKLPFLKTLGGHRRYPEAKIRELANDLRGADGLAATRLTRGGSLRPRRPRDRSGLVGAVGGSIFAPERPWAADQVLEQQEQAGQLDHGAVAGDGPQGPDGQPVA